MTREEAIKILELETRQEALSPYLDRPLGVMLDAMIEASRMGASALRAQPEKLDRSRWVRCKECVPPWCKTCIRYDVRNMDTICTCSCINHSKHKPNNFCQSCGRPLTEEAWAELERRIGGNDGTAD